MQPSDLAELLGRRFGEVLEARGEVSVNVEAGDLLATIRSLREEERLRFDFLSDLTCADWPGLEPRFWLAYHLLSVMHNHRVRLRVGLGGEDPRVPSVTPVFPTANWLEREVYDFFGVRFDGHPHLRRILMPDEWEGHPLLKTEPLGGVPTQYKGAQIPPPDQRRAYS